MRNEKGMAPQSKGGQKFKNKTIEHPKSFFYVVYCY
jgi:hypothetical protein